MAGVFIREQQSLHGVIKASASLLEKNLWRITVVIQNLTPLAGADSQNRDMALRQTFISTHTILQLREGEFVSLLETPEKWSDQAECCQNEGTWPVLVGQAGEKHTMLSSPIILYDYPEVAPESPGDFFDGTEIDEMLTLRILTMTDEEKQEMQTVDEHARQLLDRTESLAPEQMARLHGTLRALRPLPLGEEHE